MEEETKRQQVEKPKEKKKRKGIKDKTILIIIGITLIVSFLSYTFLDVYLTARLAEAEGNPYKEQIQEVKDNIDIVRANLNTIKETTVCTVKEPTDAEEVPVYIDFYDELKEDIEVSEICTDCSIRPAGIVMPHSQTPNDLEGLTYLVVSLTLKDEDSIWGESTVTERFIVNDDYSEIYYIENDYYDMQSYLNPDIVFNTKYIPILKSELISTSISEPEYFISSNGYYFELGYNTKLTENDIQEIKVEDFDTYGTTKIYVDSEDSTVYYIKDQELFFNTVRFVPSISVGIDWEEPLPITWEGDVKNIYSFDYGYDACSDQGLRVVDISTDQLKTVGYRTGTEESIYEYTDNQNEELKKLYEEDYLNYFAYLDENGYWDETLTPMTYEEFLTKHPIIFWEDQLGRMLQFYNYDFYVTGGCAKPIVYLYPQVTTDISVKVIPTSGQLTFTYPQYDGVWNVTATNDGLLTDSRGNEYDYLWWESKSDTLNTPDKGFMVKYEDLSIFFDNILTKAGFIKPEIDDFKEFWIPTMTSEYTPYFKISFLQNKEVNSLARLQIHPQPNTEIRLFMIYERLDSYMSIEPQEIQQTTRNGFTVTEWGGTRR
jgi:hypothetical protein